MKFLLLPLISVTLLAQTTGTASRTTNNTFSSGKTQDFRGVVDMGSATRTRPIQTGTSLPPTCTVGDLYNKTDATAGSNIYGCTATNTWTAQSGGGSPAGYTTVTFSATPTFTASSTTGTSFLITLTGNVTSSTLAAAATGQILTMNICQDATGSRTFVFPTNMLNAGEVGADLNSCTHQVFVWDGTNAQALGPAFITGGSGAASVCIPGSSSGKMCIVSPATGGGTVTGPAGTTNLLGDDTTQTITNKSIGAAQINSGTMATARLGSGTANSGAFLRGDSTWAASTGGQTLTTGPGFYVWQAPMSFTAALIFSNWASLKPVYWPLRNQYTSQRVTTMNIRITTGDSGKKMIGFFMDHSGTLICQSATIDITTTGIRDLTFAPCTLTDPNPYFGICTNSILVALNDLDSGSSGYAAALSNGEAFNGNVVGSGSTNCTIASGVITAPASIGTLTSDNSAYHPWLYLHP